MLSGNQNPQDLIVRCGEELTQGRGIGASSKHVAIIGIEQSLVPQEFRGRPYPDTPLVKNHFSSFSLLRKKSYSSILIALLGAARTPDGSSYSTAVRLLTAMRAGDLRCPVIVFASTVNADERKRVILRLGAPAYCFTFSDLYKAIEDTLS